jgi:hypothetical protein
MELNPTCFGCAKSTDFSLWKQPFQVTATCPKCAAIVETRSNDQTGKNLKPYMSPLGRKQTWRREFVMSALPPKADIAERGEDFR